MDFSLRQSELDSIISEAIIDLGEQFMDRLHANVDAFQEASDNDI